MMAIAHDAKITFDIDNGTKIESFPLRVRLTLTSEDEAAFELFQKEKEKEYEEILAANNESTQISKKIQRLAEDMDDIEEDLLMIGEEEPQEKKELTTEKRKIRKEIRQLEDRRDEITKRYPTDVSIKAANNLKESVARYVFDMRVIATEEKTSLQNRLEQLGFGYKDVMTEISALILKAKKKK